MHSLRLLPWLFLRLLFPPFHPPLARPHLSCALFLILLHSFPLSNKYAQLSPSLEKIPLFSPPAAWITSSLLRLVFCAARSLRVTLRIAASASSPPSLPPLTHGTSSCGGLLSPPPPSVAPGTPLLNPALGHVAAHEVIDVAFAEASTPLRPCLWDPLFGTTAWPSALQSLLWCHRPLLDLCLNLSEDSHFSPLLQAALQCLLLFPYRLSSKPNSWTHCIF